MGERGGLTREEECDALLSSIAGDLVLSFSIFFCRVMSAADSQQISTPTHTNKRTRNAHSHLWPIRGTIV